MGAVHLACAAYWSGVGNQYDAPLWRALLETGARYGELLRAAGVPVTIQRALGSSKTPIVLLVVSNIVNFLVAVLLLPLFLFPSVLTIGYFSLEFAMASFTSNESSSNAGGLLL